MGQVCSTSAHLLLHFPCRACIVLNVVTISHTEHAYQHTCSYISFVVFFLNVVTASHTEHWATLTYRLLCMP